MQDTLNEIRIYLLGLWRRRWLGLAACWVIGVIGAILVFTLPDQYEAKSRVYVDTETVLGPLMGGLTVQGNVEEEVRVMQRTLLSRPNLKEVAQATYMDVNISTPLEMDNLLDDVATQTKVEAEGNGLFRIAYLDENPLLAKQVVESLVAIFVERNKLGSRQDMQSARTYLESQIKAYEAKLADAQRQVTLFKQANARVLGRTNYAEQLRLAEDAVDEMSVQYEDAISLRNQLRVQLEETPRLVPAGTLTPGAGVAPSTTMGRIQALQARLDELLAQYTSSHPDVVATRRQLYRLIASQNAASQNSVDGGAGGVPNVVYEQIKLKLVDAESEVQKASRRLEKAEKELARLQEYSQIAPEIDAELVRLLRAEEAIKGPYEELLTRRETLIITTALQTKTDNVDFKIIEPPEIPAKPVGPNRPLFLAFTFLLALGGGAGAAFIRSQLEETFFEPDRLEAIIGVPVLGTVTMVPNPKDAASKRLAKFGFVVASACFVAFFAILFSTLMILQPSSAGLEIAGLM